MVSNYHRPDNYEKLLEKSLNRLTENDILIFLGDFCIGRDELMHNKYLVPLKCKKILVLGNHDHKSDSWYYNHGWDFVCRSFSGKYFGKKILFSHIPKLYNLEEYDMNIHGHLHDNRHRGNNEDFIFQGRTMKLISMEFSDYQLISLKSLLT
jgi:calcineurin-like phosphoesterase family protein